MVVEADGTVSLPVATGVSLGPFWSPDGSRIAFQRSRWKTESGHAIYVADSDGRNVRRVASNASQVGGGPSWSPDGRLLAYVGMGGRLTER